MTNQTHDTCIKCKKCNKGFCEELNAYIDGYYWLCMNYTPDASESEHSKINASYYYLSTLSDLNRSCETYKARLEKIEADIPAQQLHEKITGSPTADVDGKIVAYIDVKKQYDDKRAEYDREFRHFCDISVHIEIRLYEILVDYYINGKTAKQMASSQNISTRQFYRRSNEALLCLYKYLDVEFKRLAR